MEDDELELIILARVAHSDLVASAGAGAENCPAAGVEPEINEKMRISSHSL